MDLRSTGLARGGSGYHWVTHSWVRQGRWLAHEGRATVERRLSVSLKTRFRQAPSEAAGAQGRGLDDVGEFFAAAGR